MAAGGPRPPAGEPPARRRPQAPALLLGYDLAEHRMFGGDVVPEEFEDVFLADGVEDFGEAEGVVAVEMAFGHGDGEVFKGVHGTDVGAEGGAADLLVEFLVEALADQAKGLLLDFLGNCLGIGALSSGEEVGRAGEDLEAAAEGAVDEALGVEALIEGAGLAQKEVAGHVAQKDGADILFTLPDRAALEAL